ncbi:MAG: biopolymer transporter ExbD [bacterium]
MSEHHFDEEEEQHLLEQREREAKREKRSGRREEPAGALSMNSLMDIMTIILVFLLKNYGDEPIKVIGEDLKAPESVSELGPEDMTTITVSQKAILVNNAKAVDVKNGAVDKSQKKGGEASLNIQPLFDELTEAIKKKKRETKLLGQTYEPTATIIADQGTPYRLLTEVMYTAGQAELSQFKFAVVKTDRKAFVAE